MLDLNRSIDKNKRDAELVRKTLGNPDDYAELIRLYHEPIRRYVRRLGCNDKNDVDDLLQEIFLKVYINLNDFDGGLAFSSWLYRIAHNETISFFRKKNTQKKYILSGKEMEKFQNIADERDTTQEYNRIWDVTLVQEALVELEDQYQEILILRFIEEKTYTEISDILKIPMGTVATLIKRGKEQLKNIFISKNI